jgi:hypothetical protein
VTWDEIEEAVKKNDASRLTFEASQVLERVEKMGDLMEPLLTTRQELPTLG